ncbi:16S rRNA (uracil(1498)-N(3))-methyltransferase [Reinekea marinisedimentorum]|uniref:Ribosomal RNA small subunit methyltransferase E n=1 Tax=Reinekea marinisedimentorum TaxID=230495 RepID=A0A4R3IDI0_9GAMM|nr:16S rRNA (uracil(1498)-N(3))-methyltransferase [Reinekea marinisedimentorum]TCS43797.1 16S rRNA (uracil1498-N3)-methyltransferase [Reinekea marinisedimentorum]
MRVIRAYLAEASTANQRLELPHAVFQHLVKVLRLGNGQPLEVFNGQGKRFSAELCEVSKRSATVQINEEIAATPESPIQTHMGLVMSKGDRFDYALQKATELGVTHITPLTAERCDLKLNAERAEKKIQHWLGVISSACEQCYRDFVPTLAPVQSLESWVTEQISEVKLVMHTAAKQPNWPDQAPKAVSFLIGPEGGLTEREVEMAQQNDFQSWQLGPRILRTETAPVVMLSLLQAKWGDF